MYEIMGSKCARILGKLFRNEGAVCMTFLRWEVCVRLWWWWSLQEFRWSFDPLPNLEKPRFGKGAPPQQLLFRGIGQIRENFRDSVVNFVKIVANNLVIFSLRFASSHTPPSSSYGKTLSIFLAKNFVCAHIALPRQEKILLQVCLPTFNILH